MTMRDFSIYRFKWSGKTGHVYYMLFGFIPIKIIKNVSSFRANEVVSMLFALQMKKGVPKTVHVRY